MKSTSNQIEHSVTLYDLLFRSGSASRIINLITLYRTLIFPVLLFLIFTHQFEIFKWLLIISFLTDAVDGIMARKFNVTSVLGAKIDSIGDDLTILAGLTGLMVAHVEFIQEQKIIILSMFGFFIVQIITAIIRYGKISSFHTYLAKTAAILQGIFLCSMFLFENPVYWLFYIAAVTTTLELTEEIIIVAVLPEWKINVKGLFWVLQEKKLRAKSGSVSDKNHAPVQPMS